MKILVISHNPFSKVSNNGKTLGSIFRSFYRNEIIQLYFVNDKNIDREYAESYLQISDIEILKGLLSFKASKSIHRDKKTTKLPITNIINILKKYKYDVAVFRDLLWNISKTKWKSKIDLWIQKTNPNFIFFVGGNQVFAHKINQYICNKYKLSYGLFLTDDYVIYPINKTIFKKIHHKSLLAAYEVTIRNAAIRFTIGEAMSKEYENKFGVKFNTIMNCVNVESFINIHPVSRNEKESIKVISYFGGLHLNRWQMLVRLSEILLDTKHGFIINVYTASELTDVIRKIFIEHSIIYKGKIEGADLNSAIYNSDALLHIESDDTFTKSITKLSVSTKLPEYMISKKPIIGFGPIDIASMKLISDNELGLVLNSLSPRRINIRKVKEFVNDRTLSIQYVDNAHAFALKNFNEKEVSLKFRSLLENTMKNG